jgi:hypothetical protein
MKIRHTVAALGLAAAATALVVPGAADAATRPGAGFSGVTCSLNNSGGGDVDFTYAWSKSATKPARYQVTVVNGSTFTSFTVTAGSSSPDTKSDNTFTGTPTKAWVKALRSSGSIIATSGIVNCLA